MRDHLKDQSVDEGILLIPVVMTGNEIVDCVRPSITVFTRAPSVYPAPEESALHVTSPSYSSNYGNSVRNSQVTMQDLRF